MKNWVVLDWGSRQQSLSLHFITVSSRRKYTHRRRHTLLVNRLTFHAAYVYAIYFLFKYCFSVSSALCGCVSVCVQAEWCQCFILCHHHEIKHDESSRQWSEGVKIKERANERQGEVWKKMQMGEEWEYNLRRILSTWNVTPTKHKAKFK